MRHSTVPNNNTTTTSQQQSLLDALRHSRTLVQLDKTWHEFIVNFLPCLDLVPVTVHLARIKALARLTIAAPFGGEHEQHLRQRTLGALNRLLDTTNVISAHPALLVDAYNVTMRATLRSSPTQVLKLFSELKDLSTLPLHILPNDISYIMALFAYALEDNETLFHRTLSQMRASWQPHGNLRTYAEELEFLSNLPSTYNMKAKARFVHVELERCGLIATKGSAAAAPPTTTTPTTAITHKPPNHSQSNIIVRKRGILGMPFPIAVLPTSAQVSGVNMLEELYEALEDGYPVTDAHFCSVARELSLSVRVLRPSHVQTLENTYFSTTHREQPSCEFASELLRLYCAIPGQDKNAMNGARNAIRFMTRLDEVTLAHVSDDVIKTYLLRVCSKAPNDALKAALDVVKRGFSSLREVTSPIALSVATCCSTEADRVTTGRKKAADVIVPITLLRPVFERTLPASMKQFLAMNQRDKSLEETAAFVRLADAIIRRGEQPPQQHVSNELALLAEFWGRFIPTSVEPVIDELTNFYYHIGDQAGLELLLSELKRIKPVPVSCLMHVFHRLIRMHGQQRNTDVASSLVGDMQILALPINADTLEDLVYAFVRGDRHNEAVGHIIGFSSTVTPHFKTLQFLLSTCTTKNDKEEMMRVQDLMHRWLTRGSIANSRVAAAVSGGADDDDDV